MKTETKKWICINDYRTDSSPTVAKKGSQWHIISRGDYSVLIKAVGLENIMAIPFQHFREYFVPDENYEHMDAYYNDLGQKKNTEDIIPDSYQFTCIRDYQVKGAHEDIVTLAKQGSVWFVGHNNNINNTDIFLTNDRVTIGIPKFVFNQHFQAIFTDFNQWVDKVEERMFMTAKFKELGKEHDLIFQALTFTGEASQKLSIATTLLARDAYVSDAMKATLKDLQQQLHDFSELLRTVPRVGERE